MMKEKSPDSVDRKEVARDLNNFTALKVLNPTDRQQLAERIVEREFEAGDQLTETRGAGDYLYLVPSGAFRETGRDSTGQVWWERTHNVGAAFSRQASYDGIYEETEVIALQDSRLYVITPADLSWAMSLRPNLRQDLIREPIAARLRAMPLLAPLNDAQIRRLATLARVEELTDGKTICEPALTGGETWFWFIDWGQVKVTYQVAMPAATPEIITAGDFFHNGPNNLGGIPAATAFVQGRCKLICVPLSEMEHLAFTTGVGKRLRLPPIIEFLRLVDPFKNLTPERLHSLASITAWEYYPAAQTVSQQGVRDNSLRILHRGAAVIRATDDEGKERPRDVMAPGRFYGQSSLFRQERHETTVRAARPDSVGRQGGLLTSQQGQADPAQADEPGATWFRVRYEDLVYLMGTNPALWRDTHLTERVRAQHKERRKYQWQEEGETLLYDGRRHFIILARSLLIPLALLAGVGALYVALKGLGAEISILTASIVGIVVFVPALIWFVVDYLNDYFVVTPLRVTAREKVAFIYEHRLEAPLDQVQDTTLRTSFSGKLLNYGDLKIKTANAASQIVFDHVGNPTFVQSLIFEHRRRLKAEQLVEQRESLRLQLVKDLRLSLVSQVPDQTLPPGTILPPRLPWWRKWLKFVAKMPRFIFSPIEFLLVRPLRWMKRAISRRRLPAGSQGLAFQGGLLGSWDITPDRTVWRKHWLILIERVWQSLVAWIVASVALGITVRSVEGLYWLLTGVLWLGACGWLWWQYEDWANDLYIVTNEKLIDIERRPFGLSEQRREAGLDRIQNVQSNLPTFLANTLNFGNVLIKTAAADEGFTFDLVANPRRVQQEIMRRISAYHASRQRRDAEAQRLQQAYMLGVYHELMEDSGKYAQGKPGEPAPPRP